MPLDRVGDWEKFAAKVRVHIEEYTIPQYQDDDDASDQVNAWNSQECVTAIKRYINRYGSMRRGAVEALRDMLKIAHYAQFAYDKLRVELGAEDVYSTDNQGSPGE